MKMDRNEVVTYYAGMPTTFEKYEQKATVDSDMSEVIVEKKLQLVSPNVGDGSAICIDSSGDQYLVKRVSDVEKTMYGEVLPVIREQNIPFKVLQLPELIDSVTRKSINDGTKEEQNYLVLKHINGEKFNDTWDEISTIGYGGKGMDPEFAYKVIDLVEDLSLIEPSMLAKFDLRTFDFDGWKNQNLPFLSEILTKRGIISQDLVDQASLILSFSTLFSNSKLILTNGDFYPRNLIEMPDGKVAIIDWEGRVDYNLGTLVDQRNAFVNYIENHVAFFLIHMWGNPSFQKNLIREAAQRFSLTAKNLQAAILIKSLEQSLIWPNDVASHQVEIFKKALDINFVEDLLK